MIFSTIYLLVRCLLGCLMMLARREVSKDAELLVLRHENAVLRRQIGRVRYQPGDRLWLAALSKLVPRHRWSEVFAVAPGLRPIQVDNPTSGGGNAHGSGEPAPQACDLGNLPQYQSPGVHLGCRHAV